MKREFLGAHSGETTPDCQEATVVRTLTQMVRIAENDSNCDEWQRLPSILMSCSAYLTIGSEEEQPRMFWLGVSIHLRIAVAHVEAGFSLNFNGA